MSVSVFPAPATGGGGGAPVLLPLSGGVTVYPREFAPGLYAFKTQSNTSTELSGTITFFDSDNDVISAVILVDSNTGGTSSGHVGSINLTVAASSLLFEGATVDGFLQIDYFEPQTVKKVLKVTTTQTGYVLPFNADVFVFGGGGSGAGLGTSSNGAGGGGSGYLTKNTISAGTYDVVIGAGGAQTAVGFFDGNVGGTSSFDAITAAGGSGGLTSPTFNGGAGGSGGGGGTIGLLSDFGVGGINGANGGNGPGTVGGTGSGVAIAAVGAGVSKAGVGGRQPGIFYAGGNSGEGVPSADGIGALANSASGGGGAARTTRFGGAGGSGIIYLVEA